MSEEEMHFHRSQTGEDANDLHKHGGLDEDAHEDKTERENLEEAISELDESEDIEEIREDVEEEPEKEKSVDDGEFAAAKEPGEDWKKKEDNKPYMTVDEVIEPKAKKKGGAGWKVATVFFLLLAIAGCGAAAYLFFNNGKFELMGRTVESYKTGQRPQDKQEPQKPEFKFDEAKIDYSALVASMPEGSIFSPIKVDYTKDGKYFFVIADVFQAESGYAGVWYRSVEKGSTWTELQAGQAIPLCSEMTEDQLKMIEAYGEFDDDLESQYIGCSDETIDAEGGEEIPTEEAPVEEAPAE